MKEIITTPKIIWLLWLQGVENMPPIVAACHSSWVHHNPDWEVITLTQSNMEQYLSPDTMRLLKKENISNQSKSDIIRINLLQKHGGVWVDATCYCCHPLVSWLPAHLNSGFFAFQSPPDRPTLISSWFLAADKENYLAEQYCALTNQYWQENPDMKPWNKHRYTRYFFKISGLAKILNNRPKYWSLPLFRKRLKLYPYFWFHYLFETLIESDTTALNIWKNTKKLSSDGPHLLKLHGLRKELTPGIKSQILANERPLHKLDWRIELKDSPVIGFLLEHIHHK